MSGITLPMPEVQEPSVGSQRTLASETLSGHSRPTVLIGFAEALAAIETAWSLQEAGFRVVAFQRAGSRPALRHVRGVEVHEIPAPEKDLSRSRTALRELLCGLLPSALLPLDDHSLWLCSRLGETEVPIAGGTGAAADCALDKAIQVRAAEDAGLPVPRTQVLDDLRDDAEAIDFPVIVKPARAVCEAEGTLVRPTGMICGSTDEFARAAARSWDGPVLVQPFIRGVGEGLFGHVGPRGVVGWSAHRRIRMANPQGSGSSACRSIAVDDSLLEPTERFLDAIGWRGMFMLEFLRDENGRPWFMELNGRAWGSIALARRRGLEYPAWTVRAALDASFEPMLPAVSPHLTCRNFGLDLVHLMFVARGPQSAAPIAWPRLGRAILDVMRPQRGGRLYNWNRSQPDVFVADTLGTLSVYARKLAGRRR